jgi:hypothetical protein
MCGEVSKKDKWLIAHILVPATEHGYFVAS